MSSWVLKGITLYGEGDPVDVRPARRVDRARSAPA